MAAAVFAVICQVCGIEHTDAWSRFRRYACPTCGAALEPYRQARLEVDDA